ncbi:MAG: AraC family transcriptional regulator [Chthoniobacterales bacterium]
MARPLENYRVFSMELQEGKISDQCRIQRLALHRHSELLRSTGFHSHSHHQILIYLRGGGNVRIGENIHEVATGTLILLPAECTHQFIRHSRRNPLCMVVDFLSVEKLPVSIQRPGTFRMSMLRKLINELSHFRSRASLAEQLQRDGIATQLLGVCLDVLLQVESSAPKHPVNLLLRIENLIQQSPHANLTLSDAAQRCGYQRDYLNRILKQQSGMTFGQLRAEIRLRQAQSALKNSTSVSAAALAAGFDDVNYFIRWFRKQSGHTPGSMLRQAGKTTTRPPL